MNLYLRKEHEAVRKLHILFAVCLLAALLLSTCGEREAEVLPTPEPEAVETLPPQPLPLVINEAMSSNKSCLADEEGDFPDWVEITNLSDAAQTLDGCVLLTDKKEFALPAGTLQPGEYLLLPVSLSAKGETLRLRAADGRMTDPLVLPALEEDQSWQRGEDGSYQVSSYPSPGYENSEEGYIRSQQQLHPMPDGPAISEVMVYNEWYLSRWIPVGDSMLKYTFDWVEITNPTEETLELGEYYLSDKTSDRLLYRLPEQSLEPGERVVIFCDKDIAVGAPFGLNSEHETLYLSDAEGRLVDYADLHDIPYGMSMGRRDGEDGFFYFDQPTPGEVNTGGAYLRAQAPVLEGSDGVFEDVESVTVTLRGKGDIRYTLDGTEPTGASALYSEPLVLTETTVLRAVCFMPERLKSETCDLSFIINEHHSFPVVSLCTDPGELLGSNGIYTHPLVDREIAGTVALFDGETGFTQRCGVKIHGATSRVAQDKKSLKLNFRPRYGGELSYDLFGNGVTEFSSILLRADQESSRSSFIRDNLMHRLAIENFPALSAQDGRYAVLYINGKYWGIYSLREAHSEEHYARHYGVDAETVTQWKGNWPHKSTIDEIYRFAISNDLSVQENYDHVAQYLDTDSMIAWCLVQLYSGNVDFNSPNMRFYWTAEDEKLHYALVDLDLGMFAQGAFEGVFGYVYDYNYLIGRLLLNEGFREEFLRQAEAMLDGPFSDEAVLARIDEMAEQLRPEIQRDAYRWHETAKDWEYMISALKNFVSYDKGRAEGMRTWLALALHDLK